MGSGGDLPAVTVQPFAPCAPRSRGAVGTLVCILLLPMGTIANAATLDLTETMRFNVPAEPLAIALLQFSSQAHVQIATSGTEVGRAHSLGAVGSMSIGKALESVLSGTGFTYQISGDRALRSSRVTRMSPPPRQRDHRRASVQPQQKLSLRRALM